MQVGAAQRRRIHCGVEVTELSTNKQHSDDDDALPSMQGSARQMPVLCAQTLAMPIYKGSIFGACIRWEVEASLSSYQVHF